MKQTRTVTVDGINLRITRVKKTFRHRNGSSSAPDSRNGTTTTESITFAPVTPSLSNIKLQLLRRQTFGGKCPVTTFVFKHTRGGGTPSQTVPKREAARRENRSRQLKTDN